MARPAWRLAGVLVGVLALGATAACGTASAAQWQPPGSVGVDQTTPPEPSELVLNLVVNAKNVSPADPVTVELTNGTLESVSLTDASGEPIQGEFDATKSAWTRSGKLKYGKTYTLSVKGVGADGQSHEETRTFTTFDPKGRGLLAYLRANGAELLDGGTFGVGQPIVVWFDEAIKDRAAAERSLTVTTDPPVVGAWRWNGDREVHWRPKEYWPPGTKVTVEAEIYGKNYGGKKLGQNDWWGQQDAKATFTIGRSKVAIADSKTKRMKVYIDGVQVMTINGKDVSKGIPISMGKGGTETGGRGQVIDYWTRSGPHVVTTKHEVYRMTSASFGITDKDSPNYYDEKIKKSIRISGAGEFVHLADWNIWAHGKQNTSHGCINVAPAYIYWFFDQFGAGDIVDVKNTPKDLQWYDGLGDWVLSWEEWQKGSALS